MKVLNLLTLLSLASSTLLFAEEKNSELEVYISDIKKEQFNYDYEKNEAESSKLRDSWIAPLRINYSYSVSNPYENKNKDDQQSQNASLRLDQPIFQSGGIYYGIKFADASREYSQYSIDVAKRKMIKDAVSFLMQIKQTDLSIKRQALQIENSNINLELKKEQYLNGQLDSGFLDNAVIEKNFVIQKLYDIETAKERLISRFNAISDLNYENAYVPHLELLSEEEFLKYNIILKVADSRIQRDLYSKNMTITKYLPSVSVTGGYNWTKNDNQYFSVDGSGNPIGASQELDYYDYGVRASLPLDINTFRDIESSRVDYLKSEVMKKDKIVQLKALFDQVMHNLENYDKKELLSIEIKDIYSKLLNDTQDLYKAGYKTQYDVNLLQNSVKISELDLKIYEMDKQLELLTLYEMYIKE